MQICMTLNGALSMRIGVKLFEADGVTLEFEREALERVADLAIERGLGARGLRSILEESMLDLMYEVPSDPEVRKVTLTKALINKEAEALVERGALPQTKARRKTTPKNNPVS